MSLLILFETIAYSRIWRFCNEITHTKIHHVDTAAAVYALHKYSIQKERNRVRSRRPHIFSPVDLFITPRDGQAVYGPDHKNFNADFRFWHFARLTSNPDHILCARHNACRFYLTSIMAFYFIITINIFFLHLSGHV